MPWSPQQSAPSAFSCSSPRKRCRSLPIWDKERRTPKPLKFSRAAPVHVLVALVLVAVVGETTGGGGPGRAGDGGFAAGIAAAVAAVGCGDRCLRPPQHVEPPAAGARKGSRRRLMLVPCVDLSQKPGAEGTRKLKPSDFEARMRSRASCASVSIEVQISIR